MLIPLMTLLAALGIVAATSTARAFVTRDEPEPRPTPKKRVTRTVRKPTPKKVVRKTKPKSQVKIKMPTKKKAKRPPTEKEKEAAKKIKELPPKKAKKVLKNLEDIVKPKKKEVHPIVKQEAIKKIKKIKKPKPVKKATGPSLADVAKFFRAKATKKFPWVWRSPKNGKEVWSNKKGFEALNKAKTHKFIKFDGKLATKKQKQWWAKVLIALQGPKKPVPPGKPKPLPAPAKIEIVKKVVKAEETTKPTPQEAARALAIYTKEGGWQGTKDRPSLVVRKAQMLMGQTSAQADGIIGPGTRALAKSYGALLYTRDKQAPGAYRTAETF